MRPHAPPDLRVLVDRARVVEKAHVLLEAVPAVVRVRHPAAREHPREDLRPRPSAGRCSTSSRNGELQDTASSSGRKLRSALHDCDGAVGSVDRHVDVEAEAVVAPDDVAQELVVAAVVRGVDDPLLLPRAPGMRAGRAEGDADRARQLGQLRAALAQPRRGLVERRRSGRFGPPPRRRSARRRGAPRAASPWRRPGAPRSGS